MCISKITLTLFSLIRLIRLIRLILGNFAYIENRELYRNMILVVRKYMKKIILIISVLVVSQFALLNSASAAPGSADLAVSG